MKVLKDNKYYKILDDIRKDIIKNIDLNFTGSSPPEIFVGEFNYPNIYTGILSPIRHDDSSFIASSPEEWFKAKLNERDILVIRASMIYSRFISNIKQGSKLISTMQEVSMAKNPVDVNFELKKKPSLGFKLDSFHKPIFNPAPLLKANLENNPFVEKRIDYISSDYDIKASEAILDLYSHNISITSINRILSAGILGIKTQRKLVPTKWAITCVDDIISKNMIKRIKTYPWISEYRLFHDEYLANHYEILLMPRQFNFEVIEAKYNSNPSLMNFWHDYETHDNRKTYPSSVTGAYHANRLAVSEYLESINKQASVLVLREVKGYELPCGVGVLREVSRNAMKQKPLVFPDLKSAIESMQSRLKTQVNLFLKNSSIIKEISEQKTFSDFQTQA